MAELELNKIVGMIMENPELVEKIKAMGSAAQNNGEKAEISAPESTAPDVPPAIPSRSKRTELLRALESFLSEDRKKSLETIMTIADVFDSVRKK